MQKIIILGLCIFLLNGCNITPTETKYIEDWKCTSTKELDCTPNNPNYNIINNSMVDVPDECYSCKNIRQIDKDRYYCLDDNYTNYVTCNEWVLIRKIA